MSALDLVERTEDGTLATTSLIIADGTGNDHASVLRLIRNNLTDFEDFGRVGFENRPFETAGGTQNRTVAVLNREHAMFAMTLFRNNEIVVDFKKRLIKAFVALEKQVQEAPQWEIPKTFAEALRAAADASDRAAAAELQVARDAPKVAYHDDFVCTEDLLRFATVASTIGITEKRLRELLIEHRWIYREVGSRRSQKTGEKVTVYRYSEYADKKPYFQRQEVHDAPRFRGEVMHTLKITPDGATALVRAVKRWMAGAPDSVDAA